MCGGPPPPAGYAVLLIIAAAVCVAAWLYRRKIRRMKALLAECRAAFDGLHDAYLDLESTGPLRRLGQSTAFINHEIKNHMMVISGYATLLQRSKSMDDKDRAMVANIALAASKLQAFSQSVLAMSRSHVAHEDVEINLTQSIRSCIETNFAECAAQITVEPAKEGDIIVNGTPGKLERAFACAIKNSFEAGAKSISIKLSVHNYVGLVTIDDDGKGCGAESLPDMCKTFFTTKPSGMGMGFCVMRSVIEAHGGNVSVYSKNALPGQHGLSVQIVIPASKKTPYVAAKSEALLINEGLGDTSGILGTLKNLKIVPRVVETSAEAGTERDSSSLGMTVLAAEEVAMNLQRGEGVKVLALKKCGGEMMTVRDMDGGGEGLFSEEYVMRYLCE